MSVQRMMFCKNTYSLSKLGPQLHLVLIICITKYFIELNYTVPVPVAARRSLAARLLRLWVRIPPGAWIFVCCECCVLSGRGLCDGLIIRSEESYRMWRVVVCDQETSQTRRLKPTRGL